MKIVSLTLMMMFSVLAFAGGPTAKVVAVKGKVSDAASHEVLAGVKVTVKGTDFSTYTDFEGNFTLVLPAGTKAVLEFDALSYQPLLTPAPEAEKAPLAIELKEQD